MSNDPIAVDKDGETKLIDFEPLQHVQQPYIEKVVGSLLGRVNLESSGKDALLTQELLETIDQSGAWGKPAN